ncbi:MAG: rhodanese-like domain-containing protein [Phycisphaerales bacterium]|jgi:rhodanese-related sulfurtransferase|nr:rhodanese-like domain-containing protein [Phycisphaeraceae bacterium]
MPTMPAVFTRLLLIPLVVFAVCAGACSTNITDDDVDDAVISLTKFKAEMEQAKGNRLVILDARSVEAYAAGHIPGAAHLPMTAIRSNEKEKDPRIDRYKLKVVYGENRASSMARGLVKRLMAAGYGDVKFFAGGVEEWTRTGGELKPATGPVTPITRSVP